MRAGPILRRVVRLVFWPAALFFTISTAAQSTQVAQRAAPAGAVNATTLAAAGKRTSPRLTSGERTGEVATRDGLKLTLTADTGNVQVFSDAAGAVRYHVRIEADANDPSATEMGKEFVLSARETARGVTLAGHMPNVRDAQRVWVTYEVHVPPRYSVEIATRSGDVTVQDIAGSAALSSGAGSVHAGRIGDVQAWKSPVTSKSKSTGGVNHGVFMARLDTAGGHISVGDVAGGLRATTGGGHIEAGNIYGDAVLQSGGGNLRAGHIAGAARLTTGGGNIEVERVDAGVEAESAGGRIEFGEVTGAIHAGTRGGGVRVGRVTGPMQLDVRDGGIVLGGVEAPVHAVSPTGGITARFSQGFVAQRSVSEGLKGAVDSGEGSELSAGRGDIVVYLPRQIGITIDAAIEHGGRGRITADAGLPAKVNYAQDARDGALHGQYAVNGGGDLLRLRASAGNIQLHVLDDSSVRASAWGFTPAEREITGGGAAAGKDLPSAEPTYNGNASNHVDRADHYGDAGSTDPGTRATRAPVDGAGPAGERGGNFARIWNGAWWQDFWRGGVRVDADEQQKRLSHSVAPAYPDVARDAGIEGDVTLRLIIGADGTVDEVKVLSGEPVLARAAAEAVAQWRYAPALLDAWPVSVVTTVTVAFRLR